MLGSVRAAYGSPQALPAWMPRTQRGHPDAGMVSREEGRGRQVASTGRGHGEPSGVSAGTHGVVAGGGLAWHGGECNALNMHGILMSQVAVAGSAQVAQAGGRAVGCRGDSHGPEATAAAIGLI